MAGAFPLELSWSLGKSPCTVVPLANVDIKALCQEGASTDSPVGPVTLLVLVVALVQHHGPDIIHLTQGGVVEVRYEG